MNSNSLRLRVNSQKPDYKKAKTQKLKYFSLTQKNDDAIIILELIRARLFEIPLILREQVKKYAVIFVLFCFVFFCFFFFSNDFFLLFTRCHKRVVLLFASWNYFILSQT